MDDYQRWLKNEGEKCRHILWLAEHRELYHSEGKEEKLLCNLEKYGSNVYTYPQEAMDTYQEFTEKLLNNPYKYMGVYEESVLDEVICCSSLEGYLILINGVFFPIGFLKTAPEEYFDKVQKATCDFLAESHYEFSQSEQKYVLDKLSFGIFKYERIVDRFVKEKLIKNSGIYFRIICSLIITVVIGIGIFVWKKTMQRAILWYIGAVVGISSILWLFKRSIQGYQSILHLKKAQLFRAQIRAFHEKCTKMYNEAFQNENLMKEENIHIEPCMSEREYNDIFRIIEDNNLENLKPIKPFCISWKIYFLLFFMYGIVPFNMKYGLFDRIKDSFRMTEDERLKEISEENGNVSEGDFKGEEAKLIGFNENGLLFPDSNGRYLTEEELYQLQEVEGYDFQTLLSFARNEIYARRGYQFRQGEKYDTHYMQYEWYANMEHGDVSEDIFNEYEWENILLIVRIEEELGF